MNRWTRIQWLRSKESTCQCRKCKKCGFDPWVLKIPWRMKWQPTPVFLPGKVHGQRSLEGYSPWGCKVGHSSVTKQQNWSIFYFIDYYTEGKWKSLSHVQLFVTPWTVAPPRLLCPWNSPGQTTQVGSHSLLQGIFPTHGSNPGLPHCRRILYHLSHQAYLNTWGVKLHGMAHNFKALTV